VERTRRRSESASHIFKPLAVVTKAHEEEPEFYKENVRVKRLCFINWGISLV
jgi:hypothetical protein